MSLTDIAYFFRKYGFIIGLSVIFFILLIYTIYLAIQLISSSNTANISQESLIINPIFDKITYPKIESKKPNIQLNFILDTIEGTPIEATKTAKVAKYFIPKPKLSYLEKSYIMAKNLGLDVENINPVREKNTIIFEDNNKKVKIDFSTYNFSFYLKENYIKKIQNDLSLPQETIALEEAKEYLSNLGQYPESLAVGKHNIIPIKVKDNIQTTDNITEANAFRIDFFPPDFEGFPIVTENYLESPNFVIISHIKQTNISSEENINKEEIFEEKIIIQAEIYHKEFSDIGIYPLISGTQAWEKLKKQEAWFVKIPEPIPNPIEIEKMFLAYFYAPNKSEYFFPVFVFLGKNFSAYVPAIDPKYLN